MTVQMNGVDTVFGTGPGVLHDQHAVDEEFRAACGLGLGPIYPRRMCRASRAAEDGPVRVR